MVNATTMPGRKNCQTDMPPTRMITSSLAQFQNQKCKNAAYEYGKADKWFNVCRQLQERDSGELPSRCVAVLPRSAQQLYEIHHKD